jgi:hypothetical protein
MSELSDSILLKLPAVKRGEISMMENLGYGALAFGAEIVEYVKRNLSHHKMAKFHNYRDLSPHKMAKFQHYKDLRREKQVTDMLSLKDFDTLWYNKDTKMYVRTFYPGSPPDKKTGKDDATYIWKTIRTILENGNIRRFSFLIISEQGLGPRAGDLADCLKASTCIRLNYIEMASPVLTHAFSPEKYTIVRAADVPQFEEDEKITYAILPGIPKDNAYVTRLMLESGDVLITTELGVLGDRVVRYRRVL